MGRRENTRYGKFLALVLGLAMACGPSTAIADTPIPVEKFAEIPLAQSARMSPDGTKLAVIMSASGHQVLVVHDLKGGAPKGVGLGEYQARWVQWKSDTRLIAGVFTSTDELFFYGPVRQSEVTRMFGFDSDGTKTVNIGAPSGGFQLGNGFQDDRRINPQLQDELASLLENDPHHVLQTVLDQIPYKGSSVTPSVYEVDVDTGQHRRIERSHPHIIEYQADSDGVIRLGLGLEGIEQVVYVRDNADSDWRAIHHISENGATTFEPLAFVPDHPEQLYVLATGATAAAKGLWVFDTKKNDFDHLVDADIADASGADVRNGRLIGYNAANGTKKYLDPDWDRDFQLVRKALKGKRVQIVDRPGDGAHVLFLINEPFQPMAWWLLNRTVKPAQLSPVIETYPDIEEAGTAPVSRVVYTARDGLQIPAFLTLPRGHHDGPLPFVVLPHGGPWACDGDGFSYEAQFLASRGWGVLQPQFRGSSCFGPAFEQRGYREWGFAMQDDVTDGTRWLIDHKLADPSRICIVGSSYGGYAALEGVVKEPDLYRCAAAWAPVTDLRGLVRDDKQYLNSAATLDRIGDDTDRLDAASPMRHADRIKVPVLLMHGKSDFTVQVHHSQWMEDALKDAGKPVEAIYLDNADHYRLQYPARLAWLQALDRFLGANLGRPVQN